jgi:flagellar biosynthesis chaperone FliJ
MKRFQYRLERVLHLRQVEAEIEESRLAACEADLREMLASIEALESDFRAQLEAAGADTWERQLLSQYRLNYEAKRKGIESKLASQRQLVAERSEACTAARQKVEILEKVKAKQRQEWERQLQKELDEAAMDSFLARWSPPQPRRIS